MKDNLESFLFLAGAILLGSFVALIGWTLIVQSQVTQDLASESSSNPLLKALTGL